MPIRVLPFDTQTIDGGHGTVLPAAVGNGVAALLRERLEACRVEADLVVSGVVWLSDRWQAEVRIGGDKVLRHHEEASFERAPHLLYRMLAFVVESAGGHVPEAVTRSFDDYHTASPGALLEYWRGLGSEESAARRTAFQRGFELDPHCVALRVALARDRLQSGDAFAAAGLLQGVSIADPAACAELGIALWSAGEMEMAAHLLAAAVTGDGAHALAHAALASLLARRGESDDALYLATKATQLESDDYRTWAALAEVYRLQGDFDQACFYYGFALRLQPQAPALLKDAGAAWLLARQPARALPLIESAIAAAPQDAENFGNLAFAHDQLAHAEEALGAARRASELSPADARFHVLRGDLALKAGRKDDAFDAWARAAELDAGLTINPAGGNIGLPEAPSIAPTAQ